MVTIVDLLIKNIGEIATPTGRESKKGIAQGSVTLLSNSAVALDNDTIVYVGEESKAPCAKQEIDAKGRLVTPGLVDAHTHLVFGGWRQNELALKLDGLTYLDILRGGGGILSTVRSTRAANENQLYEKAAVLLDSMLEHGTTTCEAKSGYGLTLADELKQLHVIKRLSDNGPLDIAATFLGAHAIPEEYESDREGFIRLICNEMLPAVAQKGLAEFCDIFCETAVFTAAESQRIMKAAKDLGFRLKIHADEIDHIGGGELAAAMQAISAEHLIQASDEGIQAMACAGTIGVLLPATSFYLDKPFARARKMIEAGMAVAIASDFNPGSSPNLNLQIAMNIGCLKYRMTPKEVLTAVTLNAAAAIGMADKVGSLEPGKQGDLIIWDAPDLNYLLYRFGNNLVDTVIKKGTVIKTKTP